MGGGFWGGGGEQGGAPGWLPDYPAFSFVFAPYPPDPLPRRGRGGLLLYFAGGSAPGTPALNRLRHLQNLPLWYPAGRASPPGGGLNPGGTCYPCPGGEDHLKRRRRVSDG